MSFIFFMQNIISCFCYFAFTEKYDRQAPERFLWYSALKSVYVGDARAPYSLKPEQTMKFDDDQKVRALF